MPGRKAVLASDHFYHVFNRGVEKRSIFVHPRDYERFLQTIKYYQYAGPKPKFSRLTRVGFEKFNPDPDKKLVEIICYCLMPNHFHFLLRQVTSNGISIFLSQLCNSYTKYFNTKNDRVGALFQGVFQAVLVDSDEQLVHLSRYIHLNPIVSLLTKNLDSYPWSSYQQYVCGEAGLCLTEPVLSYFPSKEDYMKFVQAQADYGRTLEILKHQSLIYDAT